MHHEFAAATAPRRAVVPVLVVVILGLISAPATAQLIGLRLRPDATSKFEGRTFPRGNDVRVVGEALEGLEVDAAGGKVKVVGEKQVVLCVFDRAKPEAPVYEARDKSGSQRAVEARKLVLLRKEFDDTRIWDKLQTLTGLRDEFLRKRDEIETKRKRLAGAKLGSAEWFDLHRRLLIDVDSVVGWLRSTYFAPAAVKWEKEYGAELKRAGAAASKTRLEEAKKISSVDPPGDLVEFTSQGGKGDLKWHGRQSLHFRAFAPGTTSDAQLDAGLLVGERILESVRVDFIEPASAPEDRDPVPSEIFVEYCMCPDDDAFSAFLWEKHYRMIIGEPRERAIKINHTGRGGPGFVSVYRADGTEDFEGWVAHTFGHYVIDLAFNGTVSCPAWLGEGLAYWLSFEHLSRNACTCLAFSRSSYAKSAEAEGAKAVELGLRAAFTDLALRKGPSLSALVQTPLVTMETAHLAKAWSVIDWLVSTQQRKRLGAVIRAACATARDDRSDVEKLRPRLMTIFDRKDGDVYAALDEEWKKFVTSGGARKKAD